MKWGVARVDQLITAAFLVSGLALVLFVLLGLSLPFTLLAGWTAIAVGIWWFERTAPTDARTRFHEVLRVGAIAGLGATSPKQMGAVMAALMPEVKGEADGKLVSQVVRRLLGS